MLIKNDSEGKTPRSTTPEIVDHNSIAANPHMHYHAITLHVLTAGAEVGISKVICSVLQPRSSYIHALPGLPK